MKRKVLIDFDYAYDGVHANRLKAGRSYEIRDEHVARFEAEGKIESPARGYRLGDAIEMPGLPTIHAETIEVSEVELQPAPRRRRKPKAE